MTVIFLSELLQKSRSCKCDQVFWVGLDVAEDDEHGRVGSVINNTIVQICSIPGALGGRGDHASSSLGKVSDQDPGQVHALLPSDVRLGVPPRRVDGVHSKVRAVAVHRSYKKTNSITLLYEYKTHTVLLRLLKSYIIFTLQPVWRGELIVVTQTSFNVHLAQYYNRKNLKLRIYYLGHATTFSDIN